MAQDLVIKPNVGFFVRTLIREQLFVHPPLPEQSFAGRTVIITGANVGIGLEAAKHFWRLGAARLILGVRTVSKGEAAKDEIVASFQGRSNAESIEVWPLELQSTASTLAFVERAKQLPRLDILMSNAGVISTGEWRVFEGFEECIQVNTINTLLLSLSLLPKLKETGQQVPKHLPHLVITTSDTHERTAFAQIQEPNLYVALNDKSQGSVTDR